MRAIEPHGINHSFDYGQIGRGAAHRGQRGEAAGAVGEGIARDALPRVGSVTGDAGSHHGTVLRPPRQRQLGAIAGENLPVVDLNVNSKAAGP